MLLDVLEGYLKYEVYISLDDYHIAEARIIFLFFLWFQAYIKKKGKLLGAMYLVFVLPENSLYGSSYALCWVSSKGG